MRRNSAFLVFYPAVTLHEPMTVFTDYLLATVSVYLAWTLSRRHSSPVARSWMWAIAALAVAAFSGGTTHGFPNLPPPAPAALWKITQTAIGIAAYFVTRGTVLRHVPAKISRIVQSIALCQLAIYLVWIALHDEFIYSIVDYAITFGFALVLQASAALKRLDSGAQWIALGILASFAAAAIQAFALAPHPNFNHNDLYHVVQILGTWLIYRGVRLSDENVCEPGGRN